MYRSWGQGKTSLYYVLPSYCIMANSSPLCGNAISGNVRRADLPLLITTIRGVQSRDAMQTARLQLMSQVLYKWHSKCSLGSFAAQFRMVDNLKNLPMRQERVANFTMASSTPQLKRPQYPDPITVPPKSGKHTQSFVILHGRGSNGELFGHALLQTPIPGFGTLQDAFPDAKFIFPTASKRRAQIFNRTPINQWFDNWSLQTPTEREELQFDGLRESTAFVHDLLKAEIAIVGASNVVLWGLSQGCAISMMALLLWEGEKFGAAIGMCGWLPLRKRMEDAILDDVAEDEENPFAKEDEESSSLSGTNPTINKAIDYLREELRVPSNLSSTKALEIPVFLGHGTEDEKVPLTLGKEAVDLLQRIGLDVKCMEYEGLAHWYSGEMLRDIVLFIQRRAKWPVSIVAERVSDVERR